MKLFMWEFLQIKVAIADSGSTTLYVTEVDVDGMPVEKADSFKYDLSVDTESITFNENNKAANVTLVNQEQAEDEDEDEDTEKEVKEKNTKKTLTSTPTSTSSNTPTKSIQTTKAVKTGDNTPIGIFVILLIAAIVVIGGGIYLKRRKK